MSYSAPYYSSLDNKCYDSDNYRYLSIDPRAATSSYVHYFYPEDILFKNATYRLKVNITPVDADHTPAAPTITGSSTVNIGDVNIYEMFSPAKKVAKNDTNSSMLGSIIFGIKKLFAQSGPEETVHYMIDWGGGASPGQTDNFAYGSHASSTHIWTEATTTQIRVAAVDTLTDSKSPWTTFPITVVDPAADYTYGTPSLSTSKICSGNLTLSWNKTYRSDGALSNFYSLNKNDSIINDVISGSVTSISLGTDFANGDRYQLYAYGPTSFADPDTSKSSAPSNILTISATVPIRDSSSCTVVVPPVNTDLDVVILDGMTFSANPSWAKISGKCNFSGKIDATIKTAKNDIPLDTYTNITVNSCSVDGKTVPIGAAPFKVTAEIPFSISSLQFGIGKHKLSCEITASSSNTNSIVLAYPSVEAKCSKVPTVIEK